MDDPGDRTILFPPLREGRSGLSYLTRLKEVPAREGIAPVVIDGGASVTIEGGDGAAEAVPSSTEQTIPVTYLPLSVIRVSRMQLRRIDEGSLHELAHSIGERGILQPVLVRRSNEEPGCFELIAGERRFRAARLAALESIPALITEVDDRDSLELAIIENAQREDLNPVDEALAYKRLVTDFRLTHAEIADAIGKNRVTVANSLRLLQLPDEVIELIRENELTAGHGRAVLMLKDAGLQIRVARNAVRNHLSVRALERLVEALKEGQDAEEGSADDASSDAERRSLERYQNRISEMLENDHVRLRSDSSGRRVLRITFETDAAWRRFMTRFRE
ncbi:MAG: ParB/RepB/Spo0J family partition protein [Deltaproteobacteria bacterium]|nr:ParB/RepB/Spo0J family partition protein [Deltaproteobacteria bacterium]